jgi:ATP-dependent Clp protease ATP-binding subunit ClpA
MTSNADSFFSRYCKLLNPDTANKNASYPFKDHPQFAVITDILARKNTHHAALHADFFNQYALTFLSALAAHLQHDHLPYALRSAQILWLDIENITLSKADQTAIEADFNLLFRTLEEADKYVIFVLPAIAWLAKNKGENSFLQVYFKKLIDHPQCRVLALTNPTDFRQHQLQESGLLLLNIQPLTATDIIHLLQQQRAELEEFHHVLIPDETLADAYSLAKRYLGSPNALSKSILLIDSAAARIQSTEHLDDCLICQYTHTRFTLKRQNKITGILARITTSSIRTRCCDFTD